MKKLFRRLMAVAVAAALTAGMCITASAYTYPSAYWKLHDAWSQAVAAKSADQVLTVAQQTYDLLMKDPLCADICNNLESKCARASWCAEMKGDLAGAVKWLERERTFAQWLDKNVTSYKDALLNIDARLEQFNAARGVEVYALQEGAGKSFSGSGAAANGTWYGSAVGGSRTGESASLMYVNFMDGYSVDYWINYYKSTSAAFASAADGGVIELAWNFSPESTAGAQRVLDSAADSYIAEGLRAMGSLNATVLLRIGAEMNNWSSIDSATYIQAFQKIAAQAHQYSNIKTVFSPATISDRNHTIAEFYPGDQYVDWIGVSDYQNSAYAGQAAAYTFDAAAYGNDAYYGRGLYSSDPLTLVRPIARLAQQHNKPLMISECGFSYTSAAGGDQTAYAADQLNKLYSYANMIFPQTKAVFYFDKDMSGSAYHYALSGSSTLASTYESAIQANGSYLKAGQTSAPAWTALSNVSQGQGRIQLATYAVFPSSAATTVTYYVDGKAVYSSSKAPYYYTLDCDALSSGSHKLYVIATNGKFTVNGSASGKTYTIQTQESEGYHPSSADDWARDLLDTAYDKGLLTDRTDSGFQNQITRLQFADLAVNLIEKATGKSVAPAENTFQDTSDPAVLKAVAAGVTAGKSEDRFAPNDKITRQEICVMLNRVIEYVDQSRGSQTLTNASTQMDPKFTDSANIDSWAVNSVALLTNNGLMSGKDGGRVAPKDKTKVEEAAILILALYNKF